MEDKLPLQSPSEVHSLHLIEVLAWIESLIHVDEWYPSVFLEGQLLASKGHW